MPTPQPPLPDDWLEIVNNLLQANSAWQTPATLARRMSRDLEKLTDTLAEMDLAGWLQIWERPDGVMLTISAWGANRLIARLIPAGPGGSWRWATAQTRRPHTTPRQPVDPGSRPITPIPRTPHALPALAGAG